MPDPEPKPSQKETELQTKLEAAQKQLTEEQSLRQEVLQDPEIIQILQARRENKKVAVTPVVEAEPKSMKSRFRQPEDNVNQTDKLDALSNSELVDVISNVVEQHVEDQIKSAADGLADPLNKRFGVIESNQQKLHSALLKQHAAAGVLAMQNNHKDFPQYQEAVLKIMSETGLSLERAYIIAKGEVENQIPGERGTVTERPSAALVNLPGGRMPVHREQNTPERATSTTRRFRGLVDGAVDKVLAKRDR